MSYRVVAVAYVDTESVQAGQLYPVFPKDFENLESACAAAKNEADQCSTFMGPVLVMNTETKDIVAGFMPPTETSA